MAQTSNIQWTEATWNPWHGCQKVSPGCKFCYMFRDKERFKLEPTKVVRSLANFKSPLKWKESKIIFSCSWSDWFIPAADQWRNEAWEIIRNSPQHTFQILTKRPERIKEHLPDYFSEISDRVWIGVSIESENETYRVKYLKELCCNTFISFEPLLSAIQWNQDFNFVNWIIIGGESGNESGKWGYRPTEINWISELVTAAEKNTVPCFVKQLGTYQSKKLKLKDKHAGDINEFPDELKVREFPFNK